MSIISIMLSSILNCLCKNSDIQFIPSQIANPLLPTHGFHHPAALLSVSAYSVSGSESATMPAPAWMESIPVLEDHRPDRDAEVHVAAVKLK